MLSGFKRCASPRTELSVRAVCGRLSAADAPSQRVPLCLGGSRRGELVSALYFDCGVTFKSISSLLDNFKEMNTFNHLKEGFLKKKSCQVSVQETL